jgi:hypothetical protein
VLDSKANGESLKAGKGSDEASDKASMYTCNEVQLLLGSSVAHQQCDRIMAVVVHYTGFSSLHAACACHNAWLSSLSRSIN